MHQSRHGGHIIINAGQKHGLAAQRDPGISQANTGGAHLGCQFISMRDMDAYPQRMIFFQHGDERGGYSLWQNDWNLSANTYKFDMRYVFKPYKKPFEFFIR